MLSGYELGEELARGDWHVLHRVRSAQTGETVLCKSPGGHVPGAIASQLLRREFELMRDLSIPGIPPVRELQHLDGSWQLVLDDCGGIPLSFAIRQAPGMELFLNIGIPLCALLSELHRRDIVLRCLHPGTVLINQSSGDVFLADLALASRSSAEPPCILPLHLLRTLLPYLSPEQTGRMNRAVDYRADFYSLGIVLYEALTGVLPFHSDDTLELIHAHIARIPPPPLERKPGIPEPASQVVMKLLEKTAEQRYQSAAGVREDLSRCRQEWRRDGSIAPFALGSRDISDRFLLPQKLYGRDPELTQLLHVFDRICEGSTAMMVVAGYPGIGKTSLIQELYRPIVRQKGYFIAGKFDQVVRNIPFGALIQAFRGLAQQLLTEPENRLAYWRSRLTTALGNSAAVLADVVPEITRILGDQPPAEPLPPVEAQNRFQLVFQNLVAALAQAHHPLVIFLDDLQWADAATLGLLKGILISPDIRHVFLIGAFRDNEVDVAHPLARALVSLESAGAQIHRMLLSPLNLDDLTALIRDTLKREKEAVTPLAGLVRRKTEGNPFFVQQFLKALCDDGLLRFEYAEGIWDFRIDEIVGAPMTDNVIELMTQKIQRLSSRSQDALKLAACVGNTFDLGSLATASRQSVELTAADLDEALREQLIVPAAPGPVSTAVPESEEQTAAVYTFLHDRVQQAAYDLIPEDQKPAVHLTVGRLLLRRWNRAAGDERIFDIVQHFNTGAGLISSPSERLEIARLNLDAGRKAKFSTAYESALSYLKAGLALVGAEQWETGYDLMFALQVEAAESEYLCGDFAAADRRFELILRRARTRLDRAEVHNLKIVQYENMSRYAEAVKSGKEGLALFGVTFPESDEAKRLSLQAEISAIRDLKGGRSIDSLVNLPVMEDPETRAVMKLLTAVWAPAYVAGDQYLTRLISAWLVRLSLEHGNIEESAYGYVTHAITLGSVLGDYGSGYEFGRLALSVNDRFEDHKRRAKVHHMFSCFVNPWRKPLATCFPHSQEARRSGLESGDFAYVNYAVFHESWYALLIGANLDVFVRDYSPNVALLKKIKMESFVDAQKIILNWAAALQGNTRDRLSLSNAEFDEDRYRRFYGSHPFFMTFFYMVRLHLCVLFGAYDEASRIAAQAREVVHALSGTIWPVLLDFLNGLTLAGRWPDLPDADRPACIAELERLRQSLHMVAENCPENFRCLLLMLTAELERIQGRDLAAMEAYERALAYAGERRVPLDIGLASELYARFWQLRGNLAVAQLYMDQACRAWRDWGAAAKVHDLRTRFGAVPEREAVEGASADSESRTPAAIPLDISTVAKAAHAIAVEIVLDDLLRRLMKIALENAGAVRGFFLQEQNGGLLIEAAASTQTEEIQVRQSVPLDDEPAIAGAVVRYVRNTGTSVVLGNAPDDERFALDPYISASRPKSILCVPVVHQSRFAGILYLENNLTTDAFTADRIKVMHLLSSQAAIALENARLYEEMKQEVDRRRRAEDDLRAALAQVELLKNRLHAENIYLQEEIRREQNFEEIVGSDAALTNLLAQVERVAPTDSTVLIYGETGTGKELIARAIHDRSNRRHRPLVKVNCGAISAGLVESELFGHVRGAFTGAVDKRIGRFELADKGTLFLDEVSELPLETQVKLLRVLQEKEFEPVGSSRTVKVDVRIITASNRNLAEAVEKERFRADLYYRLNVLPLTVPSLRDRRGDIPQLVAFFLSRYSKSLGRNVEGVSRETMDLLMNYSWPGNVRELQNVLQRALVLSSGPILTLEKGLLPPQGKPAAEQADHSSTGRLEEVERSHILSVLAQTGWVIEGPKGAARILDLHPNTLRSRMKKLGIQPPHRKASAGG
jgi:predicted ATPase